MGRFNLYTMQGGCIKLRYTLLAPGLSTVNTFDASYGVHVNQEPGTSFAGHTYLPIKQW